MNFIRQQDDGVLTYYCEDILYFGSTLQLLPEQSDKDTNNIKVDTKKQEDDKLVYRGNILNPSSCRL